MVNRSGVNREDTPVRAKVTKKNSSGSGPGPSTANSGEKRPEMKRASTENVEESKRMKIMFPTVTLYRCTSVGCGTPAARVQPATVAPQPQFRAPAPASVRPWGPASVGGLVPAPAPIINRRLSLDGGREGNEVVPVMCGQRENNRRITRSQSWVANVMNGDDRFPRQSRQ